MSYLNDLKSYGQFNNGKIVKKFQRNNYKLNTYNIDFSYCFVFTLN